MNSSKRTWLRYQAIDLKLKDASASSGPRLEELIEACNEALSSAGEGEEISRRTVQKDIETMRKPDPEGFAAPIAYSSKSKGYYYASPFDFPAAHVDSTDLVVLKNTVDQLLLSNYDGVTDSIRRALKSIQTALKQSDEYDLENSSAGRWIDPDHTMPELVVLSHRRKTTFRTDEYENLIEISAFDEDISQETLFPDRYLLENILRQGRTVEVLRPKWLRKLVRKELKQTLKQYE